MDLAAKINELKKLKLAIADLETHVTTIEDVIKAEMEAKGVYEITTGVFKVHWTPYTTTRIDTTALKAELPDIAARYSKTTEGRRFSIT